MQYQTGVLKPGWMTTEQSEHGKRSHRHCVRLSGIVTHNQTGQVHTLRPYCSQQPWLLAMWLAHPTAPHPCIRDSKVDGTQQYASCHPHLQLQLHDAHKGGQQQGILSSRHLGGGDSTTQERKGDKRGRGGRRGGGGSRSHTGNNKVSVMDILCRLVVPRECGWPRRNTHCGVSRLQGIYQDTVTLCVLAVHAEGAILERNNTPTACAPLLLFVPWSSCAPASHPLSQCQTP